MGDSYPGRRLRRTALLVGVITILANIGVAFTAYHVRRNYLHAEVISDTRNAARMLAAQARLSGETTLTPVVLAQLQTLWEEVQASFPDGYVCAVEGDGTLCLHTGAPLSVGNDVGRNRVDAGTGSGPRNLRELLAAREEFSGHYLSSTGEAQLAAFTYVPTMNALVAVHVPLAAVDANIRVGSIPWVVAVLVIVLVLQPAALGLLHRAYTHAQTALRRSERHAREQVAELETLYQTAPVGLSHIGRDLRYVRINERLAAFDGRPASDHIGKSIRDVLPDLAADIEALYRRILDTGQPILQVEIHGVTPAQPDVPRDWLADYYPLKAEDGSIRGVGAVVMEVTERKRAEEALRQARDFNQQIIASAGEGIIVFDRDLRYLVWNPRMEEISGLSDDQVLGKHPLEIFPFLREEGIYTLLEKALKGESHVSHDFKFTVPKSGRSGWASQQVCPLRDSQGGIIGVLATVQEISARQLAESQLRDYADRLRSLSRQLFEVQETERRHLARDLHDEVGQLLSAISINLKIARGKAGADIQPRLDDSIGIVDRSIHLVRNMSLDLRPSILDDFGLEEALRWHVYRQAERAGYQASFVAHAVQKVDLPDDLKNTCYRIVQEALTNVARHAQASQVTVQLEQDEEDVRLLIHDNGVGFDWKTVRHSVARGGSLGLRGMQERVELLGGMIDIISQAGAGTTIQVKLPLGAAVAAAPAGSSGGNVPGRLGEPPFLSQDCQGERVERFLS